MSAVHLDLMGLLQDRWSDELVVMPRSHAKTTIVSKAYALWELARQDVHFIAIFSNTYPQAVSILADIRRILKKNETFIRLFGELLPFAEGVKDNDNEIITTTGVCVRVAGSGVETRGWTFGPYRPELIIGDDIESRDNVTTKAQRDKLSTWWDADVQPMRDLHRSRIIIVGTICHPDSILMRKKKSGAYAVFFKKALISEPSRGDLWEQWARIFTDEGREKAVEFYRAHEEDMNRGAEVLWPSGMPLLKLMEKRREVGSFAFSTEYQNETVSLENQVVREDQIVNFSVRTDVDGGRTVTYLVSERGRVVRLDDCVLHLTVDPAISQKSSGDYFAAGVIAAHKDGSRWLLDLVNDRLPFSSQVDAIIDLYAAWRERVGDAIASVGIESVMYQQALKQAVDEAGRKRGLSIPTRELRPLADKLLRLSRWQPLFEQGLVHIQKDKHAVIVEQITGWTRDGNGKPTHDDAQDVLVYGLESAENAARFVGFVTL